MFLTGLVSHLTRIAQIDRARIANPCILWNGRNNVAWHNGTRRPRGDDNSSFPFGLAFQCGTDDVLYKDEFFLRDYSKSNGEWPFEKLPERLPSNVIYWLGLELTMLAAVQRGTSFTSSGCLIKNAFCILEIWLRFYSLTFHLRHNILETRSPYINHRVLQRFGVHLR